MSFGEKRGPQRTFAKAASYMSDNEISKWWYHYKDRSAPRLNVEWGLGWLPPMTKNYTRAIWKGMRATY